MIPKNYKLINFVNKISISENFEILDILNDFFSALYTENDETES